MLYLSCEKNKKRPGLAILKNCKWVTYCTKMSSSHTWSRILALISTFNSNHVLNLSKIFELKLSPKNCPSLELTLQKPVEHSSLVSSSIKLLNTKPEPEHRHISKSAHGYVLASHSRKWRFWMVDLRMSIVNNNLRHCHWRVKFSTGIKTMAYLKGQNGVSVPFTSCQA